MPVELTDEERAMLAGREGEAAATAMRILVETAEVMAAPRLLPITRAHVDGCLYHGRAGLDFAERLVAQGARVAVPTTLNVAALDLLHPDLVHLDRATTDDARGLMNAYVAMGCRASWTCAPYQLEERPAAGEQIAWAESNAIVFANSVLAARTERYGDFIDVCCAITGRAPEVGLHTDDGRRGTVVVRVRDVPEELAREPAALAALGHLVGLAAGPDIPVLDGLPPNLAEDGLKALGAAAASSGAVAMFHAVGSTPEAPTLEAALGTGTPARSIEITPSELRAARDQLSTAGDASLGAVSLGTPHASAAELDRILSLVDAIGPLVVPCYVNTAREVLTADEARAEALREAGLTVVTDTCTYLTPIIRQVESPVMTDSAKWAWYAPGNLGLATVFGTTEECIRSASLGRVWRDRELWGG
jgi:predicted aconitase